MFIDFDTDIDPCNALSAALEIEIEIDSLPLYMYCKSNGVFRTFFSSLLYPIG